MAFLAMSVAGVPTAAQAGGGGEDLPNLVPYAPMYIEIGPPASEDLLQLEIPSERVLRFTTVVANRGLWALDLLGTPDSTHVAGMTAWQCRDWVVARACGSRASVGPMTFHAEHRHWHYEGFAIHELRRLGVDGLPDMSNAGLLSATPKMSFCLLDSVQDGEPDVVARPPFYQGCSGAVQGISPGWADLYEAGLPGQELSIDGVEDGRYALVVDVNPDHSLLETSYTDNSAWSLIELSGNGTHVELVS